MLSLSVEAQIKDFLTKHNLDAGRFCQFTGPIISATKLSAALNDLRQLDNSQAKAARDVMSSIDRLVELCAPLPLSLRNPMLVKQLLAAMEAGQLQVTVRVSESGFQNPNG